MRLFGVRPNERTDVFIDGAVFFGVSKYLGHEIAFDVLRSRLSSECEVRRLHYYNHYDSAEPYSPVRKLSDWLSYNGYRVLVKDAAAARSDYSRRGRWDYSVEMAVDMLDAADHADHIVVICPRAEMAYAIEKAKDRGARVTVVGSMMTNGSPVADDIRRIADNFCELNDVIGDLSRRPAHMAPIAAEEGHQVRPASPRPPLNHAAGVSQQRPDRPSGM